MKLLGIIILAIAALIVIKIFLSNYKKLKNDEALMKYLYLKNKIHKSCWIKEIPNNQGNQKK